MRFLLVLLCGYALSACQTHVVKDLDLIRPDNLTGYKTKGVFDVEKLNKVLPQARLNEEAISVQQPNMDAVLIKGVSVSFA